MSFQIITNDILNNLAVKTSDTKVAIGNQAGYGQDINSVAIGNQAAFTNQGSRSVAIGVDTGKTLQGSRSVAIGDACGTLRQSGECVAIGINAGSQTQGLRSISIGSESGFYNQGANSIAMGYLSGYVNQGLSSVAVGDRCGQNNQGSSAISIGVQAGNVSQGINAIALGSGSGSYSQGSYAIAIGNQAGNNSQGTNSIAIGNNAGPLNQPANSIILNASSSAITPAPTQSSFYVNPIRNPASLAGTSLLLYDNATKEVVQSSVASASNKTFVINHPQCQDKYLVHACLEGPEAGVYYRGKSEIVNDEFVDIALPSYTNLFTDFTVQLTPQSKNNLYYSDVENGSFRVYGQNGKFSWLVHALRQNIDVEPLKSETVVSGDGPYKYIQ